MPMRLYPADRLVFQYSRPGAAFVLPEITGFKIFYDEACQYQVPVFEKTGLPIPDGIVYTAPPGLLNEFLADAPSRLWGLAQVPNASPSPIDAAFGPRLDFLEGQQTGESIQHASLEGLLNDDHPQYALSDGSRGHFATVEQGQIAESLNDMPDLILLLENGLI